MNCLGPDKFGNFLCSKFQLLNDVENLWNVQISQCTFALIGDALSASFHHVIIRLKGVSRHLSIFSNLFLYSSISPYIQQLTYICTIVIYSQLPLAGNV